MANIQEISLFDIIGEKKDKYEYSFLTTYNAYLPFYEQIVLRRLIKTGCRVNTLLMDAGQFTECFAGLSGTPLLAGRDYTLIPVDAGSGVFHSKILLLLGKENATLCVGSHNLTLSGFGKNRELTCLFELSPYSSPQEKIIFQDVWKTLTGWVEKQPEELKDSFRFVENEIGWLTEKTETPVQDSPLFLAADENTPSLWEQIKSLLPEKVQRLMMISPFFDEDLRFIREITETLSPQEFVVGIEPKSVFLPLNSQNKIPNLRFVNAEKLRSNRGYLHAKSFYLETDSKENFLVIGSANMSGPAWLEGHRQNCEAVILLRSKEAGSAVNTIGLNELWTTPRIEISDWQLIEKNSLNRKELFSEKVKQDLLIAIETTSGFKIFLKNQSIKFKPYIELINSLGETICQSPINTTSNDEIVIDVTDAQTRLITNSLKLVSESEETYFAFVHHAPAIISKFHRVSHRDFFTALEGFEIPVDNKFWRIFEQIVFEEGDELPEYMEAGLSDRSGIADLTVKVNDPETLQETFSIKTADIEFKDRLNKNLIDSLSELINLINRRLYLPADQNKNFGLLPIAVEEMTELEEFETEEIIDPKLEIERLVTHYYKRTRTMMRRLVRKIDTLNTIEFRTSFAALRQITVVLGLLHWVRELEKHEKFAECDHELISVEDEWRLFISAVTFLTKLENISTEIKDNSNRFTELHSMVVGYLVWLGFDSGFDINKLNELRRQKYSEERSDGWTTEEILEGTACFLKLALYFCDNKASQTTFWTAIKNYNADEWIMRNLDWFEQVNQTSRKLSHLTFSNKIPQIGDFVIQTKMKKPEILIVSNNPGFIELVILNAENHRKKYSAATVTFVEI